MERPRSGHQGPSAELQCLTAKKLRSTFLKKLDKSKTFDGVDWAYFELLQDNLQSVRLECIKAVWCDPEIAAEHHINKVLWSVHSSVNGEFRKAFAATEKSQKVLQRKLKKAWLAFLSISDEFYEFYFARLSHRFQIPELVEMASSIGDVGSRDFSKEEQVAGSTESLRACIRSSCHHILTVLGDLQRYRYDAHAREQTLERAMLFYALAHDLVPRSGVAQHQMGMVSLLRSDHLGIIYHFYKSLAAPEPHQLAQQNLATEFKSTRQSNSLEGASAVAEATETEKLMLWFVRLHGQFYSEFQRGKELGQYNELEDEVLVRLDRLVGEPGNRLANTIVKMTLSNLSALSVASFKAFDESVAINMRPTEFPLYVLRHLCRFTVSLCSAVERAIVGINSHIAVEDQDDPLPTKIGNVLPSLRLMCYWIVVERSLLVGSDQIKGFQLATFYRSLARAGTVLIQAITSLPVKYEAKYLLEEDRMCVDFAPMKQESMPERCKLGWDDDKNMLKPYPKAFKSPLLSEFQENVARMVDICKCIYFLAADESFPINVAPVEFRGENMFSFAYKGDNSVEKETTVTENPVATVVHQLPHRPQECPSSQQSAQAKKASAADAGEAPLLYETMTWEVDTKTHSTTSSTSSPAFSKPDSGVDAALWDRLKEFMNPPEQPVYHARPLSQGGTGSHPSSATIPGRGWPGADSPGVGHSLGRKAPPALSLSSRGTQPPLPGPRSSGLSQQSPSFSPWDSSFARTAGALADRTQSTRPHGQMFGPPSASDASHFGSSSGIMTGTPQPNAVKANQNFDTGKPAASPYPSLGLPTGSAYAPMFNVGAGPQNPTNIWSNNQPSRQLANFSAAQSNNARIGTPYQTAPIGTGPRAPSSARDQAHRMPDGNRSAP